MTLKEAILILKNGGVSSPEHDARELFAHFTKKARYELVSGEVESSDGELIAAIGRRADGEPLQYIIGEVGFYRESYEVNPDCLIPREDTELLVDFAVNNIPDGERFADICTGSGCIAVSVLKNTKNTTALAIDVSEGALRLARRNAERNGVSERLETLCRDALSYEPSDSFFAILSNPPYVTTKEYEGLDKELYREPKIAFLGGEDGLDFYRKIIPTFKSKIKKGGFIALEIGAKQGDALCRLAEESSMSAEIYKDYSGNPRLAVLRNK